MTRAPISHPQPGPARERGRTLIEVMVAIAIGLMITAGVISIYGANRQTYRASSDMQRVQAAGQLALDRLAYQIRMAGFGQLAGDISRDARPSSFTGEALVACSGGFVNPVASTAACSNDATKPDALRIRYQVEGAAVAGSGENRDCLGQDVPDVAGIRTAENRFYVATSNGVPTLMCAGNGLNPAPLIPNVEDLQVRLRIGEPFGRAEQSVDPQGFTDWDRVLGVEVCVQVVSESTGLTTNTQAGTRCDGGAFPNDGRLRRTFTQVVTLRNRVL